MSSLPRHVMLLDVGELLTSIKGWSATRKGIYLELLAYYWMRGHLPKKPESLARIAQVPAAVWKDAAVLVMDLFHLGADGVYHHPHVDELRDAWLEKQRRISEQRRNAVNVRWAKYREKLRQKQGGENQAKTADTVVQSRIKNNPLQGSPSGLPLLLPLKQKPGNNARPALARGLSAEAGKTGPVSRWRQAVDGQHRSVKKAKPLNTRRIARQGSGGVGKVAGGREKGSGAPPRLRNGHSSVVSDRQNDKFLDDARFAGFLTEVKRYWKAMNKEGPACPSSEADNSALAQVLRDDPALTLAQFKAMLHNRADSAAAGEINPSALPRTWLRQIAEFATGPLDRYGKPLRRSARAARAF